MKKSDLKTGMTVETVQGDKYRVLKDVETHVYGKQELFLASVKIGFLTGDDYSEDLKNIDHTNYAISKVYAKNPDGDMLSDKVGNLIWERQSNPYTRVEKREIYYYISSDFEVDDFEELRDETDEMAFKAGNYYNNEAFAEKTAKAGELFYVLTVNFFKSVGNLFSC